MRARASNSRELITAASWSGSTLHLLIAVTDGVNAERLEGLGRPIGEDGFAVDVSVAVDQLSGAWLVASGKFSLIASTFPRASAAPSAEVRLRGAIDQAASPATRSAIQA